MIEEKIGALIEALGKNTCALMGVNAAPKEEKPKAGRGRGKAKVKDKDKSDKPAEKITVADVKKLAKKIAMKTDNPNRCVDQIKEIVTEIAEDRFNDGNIGLNDFDGPALYIFEEKLKAFEYDAEESTETDVGL